MKRILFYLMAGTLILVMVVACKKDVIPAEEEEPDILLPAETLATNEWIFENMSLYYLWNNYMPENIDYTLEKDPGVYFKKLLYKPKDKWSYITSEYETLESELIGEPVTMGYQPAFYLAGNNNVIIIVSYVYPGSSAFEAGLKRGDIILSINNTPMDTINYYNMFSGDLYSVQLGALDGSRLIETGQSLNLAARNMKTDPSIHHEVLDIDGYKIGYLAYVEFISGENNEFLAEMDNIFNDFKAEGISDLVIDLRYNSGGDSEATIHLASLIAPTAVTTGNEIMVSLRYNNDLQEYLEYYNYTDYLYYRFESTASNVNMQRVYFLTTSRSASASELLITGLDPYMDVVRIGESTYGKYVGAWVMPDDDKKWAMMPIVTKYANANGYTDFENGLAPDYEIKDDLFTARPFGDASDPMLAKAIELMTGQGMPSRKALVPDTERFKQIVPERMRLRENLIIPQVKLLVE
ncbi:MAG: S41 family peptidase [Bacteroidales bacterium]